MRAFLKSLQLKVDKSLLSIPENCRLSQKKVFRSLRLVISRVFTGVLVGIWLVANAGQSVPA